MVRKKIVFQFVALMVTAVMFSQKFKVVLDPGHGGKDTGTNHNGYVEKDIVLSTAKKIGQILDNEPGIEVIYTRKTDVFIELRDRANMANKEKADLYVSIHCNGVDNPAAYGTETFVMGHSRSAMNLQVVKQENSVIYKEANYKQKYKGFDPAKPEFSIGMSVQQEANIEYSASLASKISKGFKSLSKNDRGIKQVPLWVLDATTMPGVLIELGFVSHKTEGAYLNSDEGQSELARVIAEAIISYKNMMTGRGGAHKGTSENKTLVNKPDTVPVKEKNEKVTTSGDKRGGASSEESLDIVYKVQISASNRDLATKPANFKGLKNISKEKNGKLIKYFYGETNSFKEAESLLEKAQTKGYKSAYIVAIKNNEIIPVKQALE